MKKADQPQKQSDDNPKSFDPVIRQFIQQADEGKSPKKNKFPKRYCDLHVKTSFGLGKNSMVPWISFLYEGQTTSKGIYPCFLYYKKQRLLILAYTISETNRPNQSWQLPADKITIDSYFAKNNLGTPDRYGKSFVHEVYSVDTPFREHIDKDLKEIIDYYKKIMAEKKEQNIQDEPFRVEQTQEIRKTGLLFNRDLLFRYALSLLTKPFVILSGLSGSGKTRLALSFARWLTGNSSQVKIVSVGADWNNREYLLGYPNALQPGEYIKPDNGVLDFLIEAKRNPDIPYFLILDEMNLSYVERYFADFLSAMESGEAITLHPENDVETDWNGVPSSIELPQNLFITGTINVDETTYMFSPKVLDRANVIEFRISRAEIAAFLKECKPLQQNAVNQQGATMQKDFVRLARKKDFDNNPEIQTILLLFFEELKKAGAEFGYRTASEIYCFMTLAREQNTGWTTDRVVDVVVMQKLLPKLHGSRKKMQPVLQTLWDLCQKEDGKKDTIDKEEIDFAQQCKYPLSAAKIWQMYKNAKDNGFTSYAEA